MKQTDLIFKQLKCISSNYINSMIMVNTGSKIYYLKPLQFLLAAVCEITCNCQVRVVSEFNMKYKFCNWLLSFALI